MQDVLIRRFYKNKNEVNEWQLSKQANKRNGREERERIRRSKKSKNVNK